MLGCGASLQKGGPSVSNTVVGTGRSSSYRISALDHRSTICFFFDITAESKGSDKAKANETFNIQFITHYLHWDGTWRKRITTLGRMWVSGQNTDELVMGFDQEAAAVMLARYCTWKMETEEEFDATRWIDRSLIRLCQR
jgi:protein transport protein SEC23